MSQHQALGVPCNVPQSLDSVHIIWGIQTALWPNKASLTKDHFSKGDNWETQRPLLRRRSSLEVRVSQ